MTAGTRTRSPRAFPRRSSRITRAKSSPPTIRPTFPLNSQSIPIEDALMRAFIALVADTPVLMGDGRTRPISELRVGDEIYGTRRIGSYRRYVKSRVLAHWSVIKPAFRTTLEDGTTLVTSGDHRFLSDRGWKFVTGTEQGRARRPHLTTLNKLMGTGAFAKSVIPDDDYRRGYLCGMIRGDGHATYVRLSTQGWQHRSRRQRFRLALCDQEALVRTRNYLLDFDISTYGSLFQAAAGARRTMHAIAAASFMRVAIDSPPHCLVALSDDRVVGGFPRRDIRCGRKLQPDCPAYFQH